MDRLDRQAPINLGSAWERKQRILNGLLAEIAILVGVVLVAIGAFYRVLPEPDERFDDYSARMRRTQRRTGPWLLGGGVLLVVLGVLGAIT